MHPRGLGYAFASKAAHLGCIEQHGDLDASALPKRQSRLQVPLIDCCLYVSYLQQPSNFFDPKGKFSEYLIQTL